MLVEIGEESGTGDGILDKPAKVISSQKELKINKL